MMSAASRTEFPSPAHAAGARSVWGAAQFFLSVLPEPAR
jgi:hypothetical protein